jgi:hypothetical protein
VADFPAVPPIGGPGIAAINPWDLSSLGPGILGNPVNSAAWPSANLAIFVPFRIAEITTVYKMACGTGSATTGNFDLGIYDLSGNLLVSTGSTAKTSATSERVVDVTETTLLPGAYYLAMAVDTASAAYVGYTLVNAELGKLFGMREVASAFPLPSTVTFATSTGTVVPLVAAFLRPE